MTKTVLFVSLFSVMACHPLPCIELSQGAPHWVSYLSTLLLNTLYCIAHGMQTYTPGGSCTGHTGVRVYLAVAWQPVPVKMPAGHGPVPIKVFRAFIAVNQFTCVCSTLGLSYKTCPAPPRSSCFNGLWRTVVPQDIVRTKPYLVFVGSVARWCAENLVCS